MSAGLIPPTANAGRTVQVVNTMVSSSATGTTVMPFDNTIPQNTEGDQYMTLAITPTSALNKLRIDVVGFFSLSIAQFVCCALFQDSTANALAAWGTYNSAGGVSNWSAYTYYMTAGTTSTTTFKVRAGTHTSGTVTFNGVSGGQIFGGVMASSITITEISV